MRIIKEDGDAHECKILNWNIKRLILVLSLFLVECGPDDVSYLMAHQYKIWMCFSIVAGNEREREGIIGSIVISFPFPFVLRNDNNNDRCCCINELITSNKE